MKLKSVIYVLLFLFYNVFPVIHLYGQENVTKVENNTFTSDGIEMTVRTDKASYRLDEPIMLEITITNRSGEDRYIYQPAKNDIDSVYDITVLTPSYTEQDLPSSLFNIQDDEIKEAILAAGQPTPLNRTDFGSSIEHSENKTKICLHPNARHIERIPLGLLFDLSKERLGLNHTVIVKNKALSLETNVSFELKGKHVSGAYLTACRLSSMFGNRKSMRMLCDEAERLMEKIEVTDGTMLLTSPEHEMLTRCLDIMRELYATVSNRRIDRKPWTCDEVRKMIDFCKSY